MMTTRTFCLCLLGSVAAIVFATMLANVVIDPEEMFQTNLLPAHSSPNTRYQRFNDYQRNEQDIDALLFGSSRATVLDPATMAALTGTRRVGAFGMVAGTLTDHLPFLEYIVRAKAQHGGRIKHVLLLLDSDLFGAVSWTNRNLDGFMPPEVSGESKFRFWMRYLVSVQTTSWRESLRQSFGGTATTPAPLASIVAPSAGIRVATIGNIAALTSMSRDANSPDDGNASGLTLIASETATAPQANAGDAQQLMQMRLSVKPILNAQLRDLAKFVSICRENNIELTVAINPLHQANQRQYLPGHLQAMVARIAEVTPVWDFESPAWLANDPAYWFETSHFKPEIGTLMLRRMYAGGSDVPADFGHLRRQAEWRPGLPVPGHR